MYILRGLLAICLVFSISSCEKYLDIKTESTQKFIENLEDCQRLMDNYAIMNLNGPSDGEVSAGDFYLTDGAYSDDGVATALDRAIYTWQGNVGRDDADPQWKTQYFKVYNANLVLEALDKIGDQSDQAAALRGTALFFRSYSFWQIAQLYCKPYLAGAANQDMGIPIRLTSDINEVSKRGTVQETYDRIIQDLNEAVNLLPNTAIISSRPSKLAAYAMLARVYLSMGNYEQAGINANAALQLKNNLIDYNTISKTSTTPFVRFNDEVIFQSVMTFSLMLNRFYAKIDPDLISSYDLNDLRKTIFFKPSFDVPDRYAFTGNYERSNNGTLFCGLAVDELFLIRAECFARAGNVNACLADLNTLLIKRWNANNGVTPYKNLVANNAADALNIVLNERRKELIMRGLRWSDLRRLNSSTQFAVTLRRTVKGTNYELLPNDLRYVLLIPNEVILKSGIAQNPR